MIKRVGVDHEYVGGDLVYHVGNVELNYTNQQQRQKKKKRVDGMKGYNIGLILLEGATRFGQEA
jgi:hypothetical protein